MSLLLEKLGKEKAGIFTVRHLWRIWKRKHPYEEEIVLFFDGFKKCAKI
jgi:hypothetical protein